MMIKTLKLFILVNIFASSFLSVFADGYSCTVNPGDCPPGYSLLEEQMSSGKLQFNGLTSGNFKNSINKTIEEKAAGTTNGDYKLTDPNRLCIRDSIKDIISMLYSTVGLGNAVLSREGINLVGFYGDATFANTPMHCFSNSTVQQIAVPNLGGVAANISDSTAEENIFGCCPVGHNFILRENLSANNFKMFNTNRDNTPMAACCPNLSGNNAIIRDTSSLQSSPNNYPVKFTYENGIPSCLSKTSPGQYTVVSQDPEKIYIEGYINPEPYVSVLGKLVSGNESAVGTEVYNLVFGLPLGTDTQTIRDATLNDLDPYYCKNAAVGACGEVDAKSAATLVCSGTTSDSCILSNGNYIYDASVFVDAGNPNIYQCKKCYQPGELIETFAGNSAKPGYVGFCFGGTLDKRPLINGSVTDSLEYYLTDAANKPALASCKASGGIYTAIGCVDPSPIGLITGLIRISLGVVGGIALLQMVYIGIMYQLGDEGKIKEARSRLIATITGVAVLIFSILILRIIGVNVLDILPAGSI